jgi:hypothetical protein
MPKQYSNASERAKGRRRVVSAAGSHRCRARIVAVGRGTLLQASTGKRQNRGSARVNPQGACAQISGSQRGSSPLATGFVAGIGVGDQGRKF